MRQAIWAVLAIAASIAVSRIPLAALRRAAVPALAAAGDEAVTAFLAGFGTHLAVRSVVAVDVNLPTLNDFRLRE